MVWTESRFPPKPLMCGPEGGKEGERGGEEEFGDEMEQGEGSA